MPKPYTFHNFQDAADRGEYISATDGAPIHEATYCPEDNKLRLYLGERLGHDEWHTLTQHHGFSWSMKQECDLVCHWTPARAHICRLLAGVITDEDQSPAERSAERAERFAGYLDNRQDDAHALAGKAESMDAVAGFQSQTKADKAARRKEQANARACDMWGKAEYWQRRTAGVISHALHKLRPEVRARRIKKLQAEERKHHKQAAEARDTHRARWAILDAFDRNNGERPLAGMYVSNFTASDLYGVDKAEDLPPIAVAVVQLYGVLDHAAHYRENAWSRARDRLAALREQAQEDMTGNPVAIVCRELLAEVFPDGEPAEYDANDEADEWGQHYKLRLAYEQQMLEAETGKLACDLPLMERGGLWSGAYIRNATKNKTSGKYRGLQVLMDLGGDDGVCLKPIKFNDTAPAAHYTAPTPETIEEAERLWQRYRAQNKAEKASKPAAPKLLNLTNEDAERLQASCNANARRRSIGGPAAVIYCTQAEFSARSKRGDTWGTREIVAPGAFPRSKYGRNIDSRPSVIKVRTNYDSIVVLTDKPQKAAPAELWQAPLPAMAEEVRQHLHAFAAAVHAAQWSSDIPEEFNATKAKAETLGWYAAASVSQFGLTEAGLQELAKLPAAEGAAAQA